MIRSSGTCSVRTIDSSGRTGKTSASRTKKNSPAACPANWWLAKLADGKKVRYLDINDGLADTDGKLLAGHTGGEGQEHEDYDDRPCCRQARPVLLIAFLLLVP